MSTLVEIAIQQILFFASASDSDVHPDVAVSQLELLVAELNDLPESEHSLVRSRVRVLLLGAIGSEREALAELDSMLR